MKKITNDDTRDIAIRCLDILINNRIIKEDLNGDMEFKIQDIIHNEINKALSITEDDGCPKCNQNPYSDIDKHCPVCFDEISDYFDDDICDVMNKYIKKGFISKNGDLFFDDDKIVADFNYHIEGLKNLIKMTYKEKK